MPDGSRRTCRWRPGCSIVKADGSVLVHSDGGSYKPLNWMSPPCTLVEGVDDDGRSEWVVEAKTGDTLRILIEEVIWRHQPRPRHRPGPAEGRRREAPAGAARRPPGVARRRADARTPRVPDGDRSRRPALPADGAVARDADGALPVAVEIKRRGEIDGVEQLTRYLDLLNRDPLLAPVRGVFAAQEIKPQARVLAERPRHPAASPSTTTSCAAWTTRPPVSSDLRAPSAPLV